jgi:hypothetical protein
MKPEVGGTVAQALNGGTLRRAAPPTAFAVRTHSTVVELGALLTRCHSKPGTGVAPGDAPSSFDASVFAFGWRFGKSDAHCCRQIAPDHRGKGVLRDLAYDIVVDTKPAEAPINIRL